MLIQSSCQKLRQQPLPAFGRGILIYLGGYGVTVLLGILILTVGILLAVTTMGGLAGAVFGVGFSTLGTLFSLFLLTVTYGSKLVVAYLGGEIILTRIAPTANQRSGSLLSDPLDPCRWRYCWHCGNPAWVGCHLVGL